jgi:hypothetical protein
MLPGPGQQARLVPLLKNSILPENRTARTDDIDPTDLSRRGGISVNYAL